MMWVYKVQGIAYSILRHFLEEIYKQGDLKARLIYYISLMLKG